MKAWGDLANCMQYFETDVVFISAEGNRLERMNPYFTFIQVAMMAGATFITDIPADRNRPYNIGEREVAEFLTKGGYEEVSPGTWKPSDPTGERRLEYI
jgi:hypothetical protein